MVNKDSDVLVTTNKKDMIIYGGIVVGVILIFVIIIIIVKSKKKKKQQINNDAVDDYSDLYGYSSKNATNVRNENQNNNINDIQSNQYKQINQPQENTSNESKINPYQSTDTTTQFNIDNEYKSTNEPENPYISKDIYAATMKIQNQHTTTKTHTMVYMVLTLKIIIKYQLMTYKKKAHNKTVT